MSLYYRLMACFYQERSTVVEALECVGGRFVLYAPGSGWSMDAWTKPELTACVWLVPGTANTGPAIKARKKKLEWRVRSKGAPLT